MKIAVGTMKPPELAEPEWTGPPTVPCQVSANMAEHLNFPYIPDLYCAHLDRLEEEHGERAPGLHVSDQGYSSDGTKCPRQLWLREQGADGIEPDYGTKALWRSGHERERFLAEAIQAGIVGWTVERNVDACIMHTGGQIMVGEADLLYTSQDLTRRVVGDCKEVSDEQLKKLNAPRQNDVCQVRTYVKALDAESGRLYYCARASVPKEFFVPRNDVAVQRNMNEVYNIPQSEPKVMSPKVTIRENKGPDGIGIDLPWQCKFCKYKDVSCTAALPESARGLGTIGHYDGGRFTPNAKGRGLDPTLVEQYIREAT